MSNNNNETPQSQISTGAEGGPPSARKRVVKKATLPAAVKKAAPRKVAAKKAASKVPASETTVVRKVAAKKVAAVKAATQKAAVKKRAAKASPTSSPEIPISTPSITGPVPAPESARASRPVRTPRVKATTGAPPANAELAPPAPPVAPPGIAEDEAPRRFGRVPGGGPTAPRERFNNPPQAPKASTPFPQAPPTSQDGEAIFQDSREPRERPQPDGPPRNSQQRDGQQRDGQQRDGQQRDGQQRDGQQRDGQQRESRSKRRRDKRKRRSGERQESQGGPSAHQGPPHHPQRQRQEGGGHQAGGPDFEDRRAASLAGPKISADGVLELAPKGFGFLRVPHKKFEQARDDVFVTPETIRKFNLRVGQWIHGVYQEGPRGPQLVEVTQVNDLPPEEAAKLPHFDELKAINPARRISFETTPERFTTRVVDIMAPVGRGQRGLIVSPPRSGKTTLLLHMAEAIREKYDEAIHLMVVLVDERPEEVTEFRRALPGAEIYASSNDEQPRNHTRIAELAIERAKRLVEAGKDVFLIMDSITRLARAYNTGMNQRGRGTGSGGITIGALEVPRRLFAAARNTRGGGSLTIMATALIQTNSRADEAIYMEFKGTGNMELVLDRKIAENYIYPAVDIFKSGTRREELLLADHMLHKIHLIRRGLSGHRPAEAMERLLFFLKKFPNNPQMLLEIKG